MPGEIDVQIFGESGEVEQMLLHMQEKLSASNMAMFFNFKVDPYLRTRARNRFSSEGDDVVGQWAKLAPFTQQIRSSQGYGGSGPINRRTGRLEDYITRGASQVVVTPVGTELQMPGNKPTGELLDKVRTAQEGAPAKKGMRATVARPVLGINERDLLFVLTALAHDIEEA